MDKEPPQMPKSVQQTELAIHQPFPEYGEVNYQAPQGNSSGGSSLWEMVDDRLRGRWRLMFIVGAVLAVACMAYGWMSGKIRYQSEGSIRIIPTLPHLIKKTDETRAMPHFEMFRTTQVHFLKSNRVLDHASKSPELQAATGTEVSPRGVLEGLKVRSDRESELIFLAVEADDPKSAQAALDAVIDAYTDIYGRAGSDDVSTKLKELTVYQDDLTRQKRLNRVEQQRILSRYAKLDLPELQADKHQEMDGFQDRLSTANFALSGASGNGGTVPWNTPVDGPQDLYLESVSPRLQQLRGMMDEARTHFAFVRERFKDGTAQYVRAEKRAETAQMLYEEEYGNAIKMAVQIADSLPVGELVDFRGLSAERVKEEISAISDELQATEIEAQRIATDIQTLGDLAIGEEQLAGSIATAARRQDQLELEEDTLRKGRISVAQRGDMPFAPSEDSRKKRAILGFVGGFGASFGLFFLLGCVDRRAYGSRQLRCEALPEAPGCLGVLPDLGHSLRDPESSDIAAHCVHQIRNQIETAREDRDGYVIAISSPYQGDGKTSIVMALGWSYAAAGFRTLLIDCDLVGRSLTRQLGMIGRAGLREMLHGTSL
ncbi:MAG: hypothetical protein HRT77_17455, partial [Halioglobus sp.]|nr:hypothetical protein [Halioglobus sp.]